MQVGIGLYVDDLPVSLERLQWLSRHKSWGFVILVLVLLRLAWRLFNPPPRLPSSMSRRMQSIAIGTHVALYVLLIATPLAGWAHASASGFGVNVFGWFALPDVVARDRDTSEWFRVVHGGLVTVLAAVVVVHIAAALRHALILKDEVMSRMLPRNAGRKNAP